MTPTAKIEDTAEAWESGALGRDPAFARVASPETQKAVDDALGLQAISIRLDKSLIDDFKTIAKIHGIGYQPLMREALKRFAESEYKRIAIQLHNEQAALSGNKEQVDCSPSDPSQAKKAA
jgi:uncharacterized protein (DUF4415 family)